jgi:surface antigen
MGSMKRAIATRLVAFLLLVVFATSCETVQNNPKAFLGGAGGAAAGGLIAAAAGGGAAGIVGGVLIGGLLGGAIGNHLDQKDKELAARNAQLSLESARTGQTSTWRNPDNGHSGTITPTRTYQSPSGAYCREYQQQITVGGEKQQSYGTACRQPDGSWKIQS